jgi:hypothetical protein
MNLFQSSFLNKLNDDRIVINNEVEMMESQQVEEQDFNGKTYSSSYVYPV